MMVGKAKMYCGYSTLISAKPIPSTPSLVKAISSSDKSINISWSKVIGASGYGVYRATSSAGPYVLISAPKVTKYNSIGLTANTRYYYSIRAYRMLGNAKVYSGYSILQSCRN